MLARVFFVAISVLALMVQHGAGERSPLKVFKASKEDVTCGVYVSVSGRDLNSKGTMLRPFATVAAAVKASPSSAICLLPGNHRVCNVDLHDITLRGTSPAEVTVFCDQKTGVVFNVLGSANLASMTISNPGGRAIDVKKGALSMDQMNVKQSGNDCEDCGGAIRVTESYLLVNHTRFEDNMAVDGGAICVLGAGSWLQVEYSTFIHNTAVLSCPNLQEAAMKIPSKSEMVRQALLHQRQLGNAAVPSLTPSAIGAGGAIYAENASMIEVMWTSFLQNVAEGSGGAAIFGLRTIVTLSCVEVKKNIAIKDTGIVRVNTNSALSISNSSFIENNSTSVDAWFGSSVSVVSTLIHKNWTPAGGSAAFFVFDVTAEFTDTIFTDNVADGGGFHPLFKQEGTIFSAGTPIVLTRCVFRDNYVRWGGGAVSLVDTGSSLTVLMSHFEENRADFEAGVINSRGGGPVTIDTSTFSRNTAPKGAVLRAGPLFWDPPQAPEYLPFSAIFLNSIIQRNNATDGNGGVFNVGNNITTTLTVIGGDISHNQATGNGGVLYEDQIVHNATSSFSFQGVTIERNFAGADGGAFYLTGSITEFVAADVSHNTAGGFGGALFVSGGSQVTANCASEMESDVATEGGVVYCTEGDVILGSQACDEFEGVPDAGFCTPLCTVVIAGDACDCGGSGVCPNPSK